VSANFPNPTSWQKTQLAGDFPSSMRMTTNKPSVANMSQKGDLGGGDELAYTKGKFEQN
jgi:hypothetical protein